MSREACVERIRQLATESGTGSWRGFARQVGCSHTQISRILKGEQQPGIRVLTRIMHAMDLDDDDPITQAVLAAAPYRGHCITIRRVVDYCIIAYPLVERVDQEVKVAITKGWEPLGGVSMVERGSKVQFAQAVVKYEEVRV